MCVLKNSRFWKTLKCSFSLDWELFEVRLAHSLHCSVCTYINISNNKKRKKKILTSPVYNGMFLLATWQPCLLPNSGDEICAMLSWEGWGCQAQTSPIEGTTGLFGWSCGQWQKMKEAQVAIFVSRLGRIKELFSHDLDLSFEKFQDLPRQFVSNHLDPFRSGE